MYVNGRAAAHSQKQHSVPHTGASQHLDQGQCISGYVQTAAFTLLSHQLALAFSKITWLNVSFLQTCSHTEYSIVALCVRGISTCHLHPAQGSVTGPGDLVEKLAE